MDLSHIKVHELFSSSLIHLERLI